MFKTKKSKFKAITILIIVGLLCLIPVIHMMDYIFGISGDYYQTFDSDIDVRVTMKVEFSSYTENHVQYYYQVGFDIAFNSSVTAVEIESNEFTIYRNTEDVIDSNVYDGSAFGSMFGGWVGLQFGDNLTCQGSVNISYQLNSNPQNGTVDYNFVYTHTIREYEAYSFMLFEGFVIIAYFVSFPLLPIILFFIIHPDFHEPSKEEKEENEAYLKHLTDMKPKESEESSAKN